MKAKSAESIKMPLDANGIHNLFYILKLNIAQSIFAYFLLAFRSQLFEFAEESYAIFRTNCAEKEHRKHRMEFLILKFSLIFILRRVGIFHLRVNSLKRWIEDEMIRNGEGKVSEIVLQVVKCFTLFSSIKSILMLYLFPSFNYEKMPNGRDSDENFPHFLNNIFLIFTTWMRKYCDKADFLH